jgi:hypothetical protein
MTDFLKKTSDYIQYLTDVLNGMNPSDVSWAHIADTRKSIIGMYDFFMDNRARNIQFAPALKTAIKYPMPSNYKKADFLLNMPATVEQRAIWDAFKRELTESCFICNIKDFNILVYHTTLQVDIPTPAFAFDYCDDFEADIVKIIKRHYANFENKTELQPRHQPPATTNTPFAPAVKS